MQAQIVRYIGDALYCYADSTAMLLASIGESIAPSLIEVLTGVGLGAFLSADGQLFFSGLAGAPDRGITQALNILGFECVEHADDQREAAPLEQLQSDLTMSPALLGPLDMGRLTYNPSHRVLEGVDHYVLAYAMDAETIHLHDPAGYPYVALSRDQLAAAWKAERIPYRRGAYRYWTRPRRASTPTTEAIFAQAVVWFRRLYVESHRIASACDAHIGEQAIRSCAEAAARLDLTDAQQAHLIHFALPLGAKRAGDYSAYLRPWNLALADLKQQQAMAFGQAHSHAAQGQWVPVALFLNKLAGLERQFEQALAAVADLSP